jgi:prevent-host-death family protein
MSTVTMIEAKANLDSLVKAVEEGVENEIIIARDGQPAARIVRVAHVKKGPLKLGLAKGKFVVPDPEEDARLDAEIEKLFNGE